MKTPFEYKVIRSNRRTLALEVKKDLSVIVRAPLFLSDREIAAFAEKNGQWISSAVEKQRARAARDKTYSEDDIKRLRALAKEVLPQKTAAYAEIMGVKPTAVHITSAKTRYGSCSGKNSISYSLYLMEKSDRCIDYVVVHELAHIIYHNHKKEFYALIESVLPDYKERIKELKNS